MQVDLLSAILSYATIPLYVGGLLVLIYIIARSQTGFSLSGEVKQVVAMNLEHRRREVPISAYLIVTALFALFTVLTVLNRRRPAV